MAVEGVMTLRFVNVGALTPYDFEVLEEKMRKLLNSEGIEANIYNSVTGNDMCVRNG